MALADLVIAGERRKVLMQAPKNGFFYVLDRQTGKLISAEKLGKVTWADRIDSATGRPVEVKGARYETGDAIVWPSPTGAHSWQSMSFSPKTGLVYIPYMQVGVHLQKGKPQPGLFYIGGLSISGVLADPQDGKGALIAWDPVAQKARWRVQQDTLWNGGTLSTAGDLVFQGTGDGFFTAYDAASGERLWRFNAGLGIIGAPISYSVAGRQYVSILVGYGGATAIWNQLMPRGWKYGAQPRRLLTFSLGGKAELPPTAPRSDSAERARRSGGQDQRCGRCGGTGHLQFGLLGMPRPQSQFSRLARTGPARVADRAQRERDLGGRARRRAAGKRNAPVRDARAAGGSRHLRLYSRGRRERTRGRRCPGRATPLNSARSSRLSNLPISL